MTDPEPSPDSGRRRPPPGRVSPEALAAGRGGAVEGLAWLGRPPEAKASILYRLLRLVGAFPHLRRLSVPDRDIRAGGAAARRLPPGRGGAPWLDGPVRGHARASRPQPRAWFLGSGPSTFTSRWRERLIHRVGGLAPGLARRGRDRPARRVGAGRHRQRRRSSSRCRKAPSADRPDGSGRSGPAGRSSPCARTHRSCRWRWPAPRSCTSAGGWPRGSCRSPRRARSPVWRRMRRCPAPGIARGARHWRAG